MFLADNSMYKESGLKAGGYPIYYMIQPAGNQ